MNTRKILAQPAGFLPIFLSLAALALVLARLVWFGTARQADEGTAAHLWQLLVGAQLPVVAYFAIKWLPWAPRAALAVLLIQAAAGLAALAPIFLLHW